MTNRAFSPARIALVALLIAITVVFTYVIKLPIAGGYLNLSDVAVTFVGFIFGPWIGAISGGVGTALADPLAGYPQYAPFSLVAHGLEGFLIGLIAGGRKSLPRMLAGWFLGSLAMIGGYFVADRVLSGTWALSIADLPGNAIQAVVGIVGGLPLTLAVRQAYPPIDQVGRDRTWREE